MNYCSTQARDPYCRTACTRHGCVMLTAGTRRQRAARASSAVLPPLDEDTSCLPEFLCLAELSVSGSSPDYARMTAMMLQGSNGRRCGSLHAEWQSEEEVALIQLAHDLQRVEAHGVRVRRVLAPAQLLHKTRAGIRAAREFLQVAVLPVQPLPQQVEERTIRERVAILLQEVVGASTEVGPQHLVEVVRTLTRESQIEDARLTSAPLTNTVTLSSRANGDAPRAKTILFIVDKHGRVVGLELLQIRSDGGHGQRDAGPAARNCPGRCRRRQLRLCAALPKERLAVQNAAQQG
eukprot:CAMPEP_0177294736 /NCGR_PEP_ID=MMETSP0368-20130122/1487_1 /TAXON_ID=447022 ORGANISM="Scrippsiella hangoei-like, Strain SHHI-4" /NCGR_SAMPLE_ID=MMETSP0368 /ASSEMBLY_ACC=CAM_ASM_000363 /LENGTH=292 /DNA_ID=CAMNT_0018752693 /DNA_START=483 /DNA_END=1359 /DNA_ORIENTATION=-